MYLSTLDSKVNISGGHGWPNSNLQGIVKDTISIVESSFSATNRE